MARGATSVTWSVAFCLPIGKWTNHARDYAKHLILFVRHWAGKKKHNVIIHMSKYMEVFETGFRNLWRDEVNPRVTFVYAPENYPHKYPLLARGFPVIERGRGGTVIAADIHDTPKSQRTMWKRLIRYMEQNGKTLGVSLWEEDSDGVRVVPVHRPKDKRQTTTSPRTYCPFYNQFESKTTAAGNLVEPKWLDDSTIHYHLDCGMLLSHEGFRKTTIPATEKKAMAWCVSQWQTAKGHGGEEEFILERFMILEGFLSKASFILHDEKIRNTKEFDEIDVSFCQGSFSVDKKKFEEKFKNGPRSAEAVALRKWKLKDDSLSIMAILSGETKKRGWRDRGAPYKKRIEDRLNK